MNKVTSTFLPSQALKSNIILDYKGFFRNKLNQSDLSVLKFFLKQSQINNNIAYPHSYIALATGCPIITVRRAIIRLARHGMIQSWPGAPCTYVVNQFFSSKAVLSWLKFFLAGFMAFSLLRGGDQLLTLNELNIKKAQAAAPKSAAELSCWQVMEMNTRWGFGSVTRSGSWQYQENEAKHPKQDESMFNFTEQQLETIAGYSKEAVARAGKRLQQVTSQGRAPADPYTWFLAICRNYNPTEDQQISPFKPSFKQEQQPPIQSEPYKRPQTGPKSVYKATHRVLESDYEFAFNVERILHDRMLNDETSHKDAARYANPKWSRISFQEQCQIMKDVHIDCTCRENIDRSLPIEQPPISKSNEFNWNDLVPSVREISVRTESVSDNSSHFMSEPPPFEGDNMFEEILD